MAELTRCFMETSPEIPILRAQLSTQLSTLHTYMHTEHTLGKEYMNSSFVDEACIMYRRLSHKDI